MKELLKYLRPYTKLLIIGPTFKLFEAILELFLPYYMSKIIDIGVANRDSTYILRTGLLMLGIATVGVIFALICQYSASLVSQGVGTNLRNDIFAKIMTFSGKEVDQFGTSSLVNRITSDVNQIQLAVAMLIRLVIRAPFLSIGGFAMAVFIDAKLALVMLAAIPVFVLILVVIMRINIPHYKMLQKRLDRIGLVLRENLSGVRVIRAFAREDHETERFDSENAAYEKQGIRVGRIAALLNPLTNLVMNLAIGAILWFGGIRVYHGAMTTGEIIAFIGYVAQILASLIIISNLVIIFTKAFASGARISEILHLQTRIVDGEEQQEKARVDWERDAVAFKDVTFRYDPESEAALSKITFAVEKGNTVGIIGGTGSGKSTLLNLLVRFYDATEGVVYVDGADVKSYALSDLRNRIGIVPQNAVLFTGTIAENIRWGNQNATKEQVYEAARAAQALEFIEKMPQGFDTMITRDGRNVSGGQRQRLTIARALVRKPSILLLDDSFSALDFVTDANVRAAMKEIAADMTTFIVTQRASTIQSADQIIVMEDGMVAGIGTHKELLEICPVYQEICESQTKEEEGIA